MQEKTFTIYGVFKRDRCIYVGCTKDIATRSAANKVRFGKDCEIKALAVSEMVNLARTIERNYIRKYRAMGQAEFNLIGLREENEKLRSIKISDEVHERLKVMAALERRSIRELVNECFEKLTEPYKSIRYVKRKQRSRKTKP